MNKPTKDSKRTIAYRALGNLQPVLLETNARWRRVELAMAADRDDQDIKYMLQDTARFARQFLETIEESQEAL